MQWLQGTPFYLAISGLFSLYLSALSFRYRKAPGKKYFWILSLLVSLMILTTVLELMSPSFGMKLWWRNIEQIPLFFAGLFLYALVLDFSGKSTMHTVRQLKVLSIPIWVYLILIFTDSFLHLMRTKVWVEKVGTLGQIAVHPTLLSTVFIAYDDLLCIVSVFILAVNIMNIPKYNRKQYELLLLGAAIPILLILLYPALHVHVVGYIALSFLPGILIIYYALFRHQLLSIWPLAKDKIFENMKDGIVLTNHQNVIVDLNDAARDVLTKLTSHADNSFLGRNVMYYLEQQPALTRTLEGQRETTTEVTIEAGELRSYRVTSIPIEIQNAMRAGTLLIFSDITDLKEYERDLIRAAATDDLTGLFNRKQLIVQIEESLLQSSFPASLLLMDIDNFKDVNDRFGHIVGDEVLISFSNVLRETIGATGLIARMGGEEFGVFLFGHSDGQVLQLAELLRSRVEMQPLIAKSGKELRITVSIGIAVIDQASPSEHRSFEELYRQADRALYIAKGNGKNQVAHNIDD